MFIGSTFVILSTFEATYCWGFAFFLDNNLEEGSKQLLIDELIKAWEDAIRNDQKAEIEECKPSTCLDQLDHRNESMVNVQPSTVEVNHSLIFKELQMRWNNNEKKAPKQEVKKSNDESVQDHESEELVVDVPKITIISPTSLSSIARAHYSSHSQ